MPEGSLAAAYPLFFFSRGETITVVVLCAEFWLLSKAVVEGDAGVDLVS